MEESSSKQTTKDDKMNTQQPISIESLPLELLIPALQQENLDLQAEILKIKRPTLKLIQVSKSCFLTIEDRSDNPLDGKLVAVNINNQETSVVLVRNPDQLQNMLDSVAYLQMEVEDFFRDAKSLFTPQDNAIDKLNQAVFEATTQDNLIAVSVPLIDLVSDVETKSEAESLLEGLCSDLVVVS